jgi:hypothetical protein
MLEEVRHAEYSAELDEVMPGQVPLAFGRRKPFPPNDFPPALVEHDPPPPVPDSFSLPLTRHFGEKCQCPGCPQRKRLQRRHIVKQARKDSEDYASVAAELLVESDWQLVAEEEWVML